MAVGIPFVATPIGAMAEIGEAGTTHFHATSNDEWFRTLELLLADAHLRQTMGASGRRHAVEHYSLSEQADKLACALRDAAACGRTSPGQAR
jgi:glycosyltransferase involved in cell wall biosynthesis